MLNKYPIEFEELYQRIFVNKEEIHKVLLDYPEMMKREDMKMIEIVPYLEKYVGERNKSATLTKGKNVEFIIGDFVF